MIRRWRVTDSGEINRWYDLQEEKPIHYGNLPEVGFIEEGVAAGFLIQTDSGFGIIEGFVTNPEVSSEVRHRALYDITMEIFRTAKELGLREVIALTRDPSIISRAMAHNFEDLGFYCLLAKEI